MLKNIKLLRAILAEYGKKEFFKRINKIYNIKIPNLQESVIIFLTDRIIINDSQNNVTYTLQFYEEYYKYIKDYGEYSSETCYDNNCDIFRKSYLFKTSDDYIIVVDEINDQDIKSKRIIKTFNGDEFFNNGIFERELLSLNGKSITENYNFTNRNGIVNAKKVISLPNCLYYYSYKSKLNIPEVKNTYHIIETGATTNIPIVDFCGRIRNKNEALQSCLVNKIPTIIVRGALLGDNEILKRFYKVTISKTKDVITIQYLSSDINGKNVNTKIITLPKVHQSEFTIDEISNIITAISNNFSSLFQLDFGREHIIEDISKELNQLISAIKEKNHQKSKSVDVIDFKLHQYDDIDHLAFDFYQNLKLYEQIINSQIGISPENPGFPPKILKK